MTIGDICPVCKGGGEDPDTCGCRCMAEGLDTDVSGFVCQFPGHGCINCGCDGCGGSCPYCGGTGKAKDWAEGGPYKKDGTL